MQTKRKRRFGDRYDGWKLRNASAYFSVIPHIMKRHSDSSVYFDDEIDIGVLEDYVQKKRQEDPRYENLSLSHVMITAMLHVMIMRPALNRFVIGGKVYARNSLTVCMAVKHKMSSESAESIIKPVFEKTDALFEVYSKIMSAIEEDVRSANGKTDTDNVANILRLLPSWLIRLVVNIMIFLDNHGKMPKAIHRASPFHTSLFVTNVGSLGIGPIYHHIYDFGTTSIFFAIGKKEWTLRRKLDGSITEKRVVRIKIVADERICDGFYYAHSFRLLKHMLKHPDALEKPPAEAPEDPWL